MPWTRGASSYDSQNRQRVIDVDVPVEIEGVTFNPGDLGDLAAHRKDRP